MILGLSVATFTLAHVAISLVGILAGLVVLLAMIGNRYPRGVTALFLIATVLTSVTGFLFPFAKIGPPQVVGAISLVVMGLAIYALYGRKLAGIWRPTYVIAAVAALYFNAFVGVAQAFQNLPTLNMLAPTGTEPPFLAAQAGLLAVSVVLGILAVRQFRPPPPAVA